jgi:hypothetical protein
MTQNDTSPATVDHPRRVGILLLGGDKRNNWTNWYRTAIPEAERLWRRHLDELEQEGGRDA